MTPAEFEAWRKPRFTFRTHAGARFGVHPLTIRYWEKVAVPDWVPKVMKEVDDEIAAVLKSTDSHKEGL